MWLCSSSHQEVDSIFPVELILPKNCGRSDGMPILNLDLKTSYKSLSLSFPLSFPSYYNNLG